MNVLFSNIPAARIDVEDPHELQRRSFEVFGHLLSGLAKKRPLVVVIDDMQWTDSESIGVGRSSVNFVLEECEKQSQRKTRSNLVKDETG